QSEQTVIQFVRAGEIYFLRMNQPQRHRDTKKLAADKRRFTRIRTQFNSGFSRLLFLSAFIRVHPRLVLTLALCLCVSVAIFLSSASAQQTPAATAPLEGCLQCHNKIEPMHRFGPTTTLDKLDNGKDALGLTCTACHGGN